MDHCARANKRGAPARVEKPNYTFGMHCEGKNNVSIVLWQHMEVQSAIACPLLIDEDKHIYLSALKIFDFKSERRCIIILIPEDTFIFGRDEVCWGT